MGTLNYQCLAIDGPPGSKKEESLRFIRKSLFKKWGWVSLNLMSDLGEFWLSSRCREDPRIRTAAGRIRECPKASMALVNFVGFVEARKRSYVRRIDYGLSVASPSVLRVVLLPGKEKAFKNMQEECSTTGKNGPSYGEFSILYEGYQSYVNDNPRRVLALGPEYIFPMKIGKKIFDTLREGVQDARP